MSVGDTIPPLRTAPISRTTLALYAGASGDHNPIHIDIDFAQEAGLDDVIAHGMLVMAYLGRALTDWIPQSALKNFGVRFTSITNLRDAIVCTGTIVEKDENRKRIRVELQAANQDGDVKLAGEATFELE
jgi:acyl dehydratase